MLIFPSKGLMPYLCLRKWLKHLQTQLSVCLSPKSWFRLCKWTEHLIRYIILLKLCASATLERFHIAPLSQTVNSLSTAPFAFIAVSIASFTRVSLALNQQKTHLSFHCASGWYISLLYAHLFIHIHFRFLR